jgi:hypothetical protein
MSVNKSTEDIINLTQERTFYESLDCTITFFGVTHTSNSLEETLIKEMEKYNFNSILFEEHIQNGFDPSNVSEHQAIKRYASNRDINIRSMDIPKNSNHIDCLSNVMSELADNMIKVKNGELTSEDGMIKFNGRYEAEEPELYSFAHQLRNDRMSVEIIEEARSSNINKIGIVVGKSHIFGSDSIISKLENNLDKYF